MVTKMMQFALHKVLPYITTSPSGKVSFIQNLVRPINEPLYIATDLAPPLRRSTRKAVSYLRSGKRIAPIADTDTDPEAILRKRRRAVPVVPDILPPIEDEEDIDIEDIFAEDVEPPEAAGFNPGGPVGAPPIVAAELGMLPGSQAARNVWTDGVRAGAGMQWARIRRLVVPFHGFKTHEIMRNWRNDNWNELLRNPALNFMDAQVFWSARNNPQVAAYKQALIEALQGNQVNNIEINRKAKSLVLLLRLACVPQDAYRAYNPEPPQQRYAFPAARTVINQGDVMIAPHKGLFTKMADIIEPGIRPGWMLGWGDLPAKLRKLPQQIRAQLGDIQDAYTDDLITLRRNAGWVIKKNTRMGIHYNSVDGTRSKAELAKRRTKDVVHSLAVAITSIHGVRHACLSGNDGSPWMRDRDVLFVGNNAQIVQNRLIQQNPFMRNKDTRNIARAWAILSNCLEGQGFSAGYLRAIEEWDQLKAKVPQNAGFFVVLTDAWPRERDPSDLADDTWRLELSVNYWRSRYVTWKRVQEDWVGTTFDHPNDAVPGLNINTRSRGVRLLLFIKQDE